MRPEPTPLDLKALEAEFYARPDHAHLKSLQTLHSEAHQLLCRTLQELRAFVMAKDDEVQNFCVLRSIHFVCVAAATPRALIDFYTFLCQYVNEWISLC